MANVQDFLIQCNVKFNSNGALVCNPKLILGNVALGDPQKVAIGDHVSWLVQVSTPDRSYPPYEVSFDNRSFFGVSSLNVPAGGLSPVLAVSTLKGRTKFSIIVPGLGTVLDPEMQTGEDGGATIIGLQGIAAPPPVQYTVIWDVTANAVSGVPGVVKLGDTVVFLTQNPIPDAGDIIVEFPSAKNDTSWAAPFGSDQAKFPTATVANPKSATFTVGDDPNDRGTGFVFYFHSLAKDKLYHSCDCTLTLT